jgi:hypothetical protein
VLGRDDEAIDLAAAGELVERSVEIVGDGDGLPALGDEGNEGFHGEDGGIILEGVESGQRTGWCGMVARASRLRRRVVDGRRDACLTGWSKKGGRGAWGSWLCGRIRGHFSIGMEQDGRGSTGGKASIKRPAGCFLQAFFS